VVSNRCHDACNPCNGPSQVLLYGTEAYDALIGARQHYVDHRTLDAAARLVQRYFRGRLFQRFVRINREMIAERREQAAQRKQALLERYVAKVQTTWRGFIVRRILTDVAQASTFVPIQRTCACVSYSDRCDIKSPM
jgi:hypothetical protein